MIERLNDPVTGLSPRGMTVQKESRMIAWLNLSITGHLTY